MITTSHDPSARLKKFVKEVRLLFPNAQRLNRGNYEYKQVRERMMAVREVGKSPLRGRVNNSHH